METGIKETEKIKCTCEEAENGFLTLGERLENSTGDSNLIATLTQEVTIEDIVLSAIVYFRECNLDRSLKEGNIKLFKYASKLLSELVEIEV